MNFIFECIHILITLIIVSFFSIYTHIVLILWQSLPIEEEPSTPIYITRTIGNNK